MTEARLCFDGALANSAIMDFGRNPPADWVRDRRNIPKFLNAVRQAEYHPICGGTGPLDIWPPTAKQSTGKSQPPGKPSIPTFNQSAGTNSLTVIVTTLSGQPIWDIHTKLHDTVEIGTRSTFAIYNFLGRLVKDQNNEINTLAGPAEDGEDSRVLTVHKEQAAGCFVSAVFDLGVYCVPTTGAENTKRSFSILSQLLALKTTTDDLQLQPIFRLQTQ